MGMVYRIKGGKVFIQDPVTGAYVQEELFARMYPLEYAKLSEVAYA